MVTINPVEALTFFERVSAFKIASNQDKKKCNPESGKRWLNKFREKAPFHENKELWAQFLKANELTEEDLHLALGMPPETLVQNVKSACSWVEDFEVAINEFPWDAPPPLKWSDNTPPSMKILIFARPVVAWALNGIKKAVRSLSEAIGNASVPDPEKISEHFMSSLMTNAYAITHRTLVLELNVARLRGELTGETPEQRFQSYLKKLEDPNYAQQLFREYVVMTRLLMESSKMIADVCVQFIQRLIKDWSRIESYFFKNHSPGKIISITMSGDSHRGGQRVMVLQFQSGQKLVYKPHSLSIDCHFQELLTWFNEKIPEGSPLPKLRATDCLNFQDYGWVGFVDAAACKNKTQVKRFYKRQGGLLALLYSLLATDFHYENLIAVGEYPILVDLESLFHPILTLPDEDEMGKLIRSAFSYSVLRTALLPNPQVKEGSDNPFDFGGLTDMEGQMSPRPAPVINMAVQDQAKIERTNHAMKGGRNMPVLDGEKPDPVQFTEEIVQGFSAMCQLIIKHRDELLAANGPIQSFAGDHIRFIFRHTQTYSILLRETFHPDVLRNSLNRDLELFRVWAKLEDKSLAPLIQSELDSLWKGDIPFFHTKTDTLDLYDFKDNIFSNHLGKKCLDEVKEHISKLNEEDLNRQKWFIRGAMACQKISPSHDHASGLSGPSFILPKSDETLSKDLYLTEACRIGDRLSELAMRGEFSEGEGATWLGMILRRENIWQFLPVGIDFYNGLGGITFFLGYLGHISGKKTYEKLSRAALNMLRWQQKTNIGTINTNGAFTGWGGLLYLYTHLAHLWKDSEILSEALACVELMDSFADEDENFDILYGNAGGILALESLYSSHPKSEILKTMEKCGAALLFNAKKMNPGLGWCGEAMNCKPLAGFSHGASGIACALEALFRCTGKEIYKESAKHALAYESSLFSEEKGNWFDLRGHHLDLKEGEEPPPNFPVAWCNGSPGIGLSRTRMPTLKNHSTQTDVERALASVRKDGWGYTHSLCHGDLGNIELLLEAQRSGWSKITDKEIDQMGSGILAGIRENGWVCGTPRGIETPGFMLGLAGIGYGFLRLYNPNTTPSILLLAPPVS